ncbi:flagellar biosynthesis regulator FlaF [Alsobacter sp. KACC 23698]|uniref:Flagellar biosynthesis regulator FlaF n=1 Tax=Alsobacter sp. KACC 23698 TaxID=3149229 RepID=A0AAU7JAA5_9HYPH
MSPAAQPSAGRFAPACPVETEIELANVSAAQAARLAYAQRAYASAVERSPRPRCLEAEALVRAATRLYHVQTGQPGADLHAALDYNSTVWRVLAAGASEEPEDRLSGAQKQCLANLKHVLGLAANYARSGGVAGLTTLIDADKSLAQAMRDEREKKH